MTLSGTVLFFIAATVLVLIAGVVLMAIGGKANKKYGNKLMIARITLQVVAILLLGVYYFFYR